MAEAGKIFVKWEASISDYMKDSKAAREEMKTAMSGTVAFGKGMMKAGAAITAMGAGTLAATGKIVRGMSKAGDEIHKAGLRTGFSADALSRWRVAAQRSGTDLAAVETGVKRMQRSIIQLEDGLAESTRSFDRLGLSLEDIQHLQPEEQMRLIMERMADIEDPTRRAAVAQEIFGRSGTQLLPVLEDGAEGLQKLLTVAEDTGEIFDEKGAKASAEYEDALRDLKGSFAGIRNEIGRELMPVFMEFAGKGIEVLQATRDWIKENRELIGNLGRMAIAIGAVFAVVGPLIGGLGTMAVLLPQVAIGAGMVKAAVVGTNPVLLASAVAIMGVVKALDIFANRQKEKIKLLEEEMNRQKELMALMHSGMDVWKEYGDSSLESLREQGVSLQEAVKATAAFMKAEADASESGNHELAGIWRRRRMLYHEYTQEMREEQANLSQDEVTQTEETAERVYTIEEELQNKLDELRKNGTESQAQMVEDLKAQLEELRKANEELVKDTKAGNEDMGESSDSLARRYGNAAGHIIEGNIASAISGLIMHYLNTLGPLGIGLAAAAPSLVRSLMPDMPRFADGGLISGPTLGLMGEYAGARNNPEVVAPLNKLKGMIGGGGGTHITIDRIIDVENLSPENVDSTLNRMTEGIKRRLPEAIEFVKRSGDLNREIGGLA